MSEHNCSCLDCILERPRLVRYTIEKARPRNTPMWDLFIDGKWRGIYRTRKKAEEMAFALVHKSNRDPHL